MKRIHITGVVAFPIDIAIELTEATLTGQQHIIAEIERHVREATATLAGLGKADYSKMNMRFES